ncbi:MAG: hypothetical protein ABEJ92_05365 [Halobacteriales archaeon]
MALSTDSLLFSIVLVLAAIQTSLPSTEGSTNVLLVGLGLAVLALLGSVVTTMRLGSGTTAVAPPER